MSLSIWFIIVGAVIFVIALTRRPFRIFVLYMLPVVGAWLALALGWVGSDAILVLAGAAVIAELVIWRIRRRSKATGKQRIRLSVPRESARP